MDKTNSPAEIYLQDISAKLTDSVNKLKLCSMLSDESTIFLVFNSQTIGEDIDYMEDLDLINNYMKSD
jgi:hypothetical protein